VTINFDALTAEQVRLAVRLRGEMLSIGYRLSSTLVVELDLIRMAYVERVRLPTYLNHMLADVAPAPVGDCRLYWPGGDRIELTFRGGQDQPVLDHIAKRFSLDTLPGRVEYEDKVRFL
jgi:hypothetical protein